MANYAVAWSDESGAMHSGRLELAKTGLSLEAGNHRTGRMSVRRMRYLDVLKAEMAPSQARLGSRPTVAIRGSKGSVYIAPTGAGMAREVLNMLQLAL